RRAAAGGGGAAVGATRGPGVSSPPRPPYRWTAWPRRALGASLRGEPPESRQQLRPRSAEVARDGRRGRPGLEQLNDVRVIYASSALELHEDEVPHGDDGQEPPFSQRACERPLVALEPGAD